jgi:hypothetical protein
MERGMQWATLALLAAALGTSLVAYRGASPAPALACRAGSEAYVRLELLFGTGRKGGGEISEAEWRAFLDAEVTPRFPDGLTVLSGYGQWRNPAGVIAKEGSKVLIVWHKPQPGTDAKIETIRAAYKARFGQESVLRADGASCVSF